MYALCAIVSRVQLSGRAPFAQRRASSFFGDECATYHSICSARNTRTRIDYNFRDAVHIAQTYKLCLHSSQSRAKRKASQLLHVVACMLCTECFAQRADVASHHFVKQRTRGDGACATCASTVCGSRLREYVCCRCVVLYKVILIILLAKITAIDMYTRTATIFSDKIRSH